MTKRKVKVDSPWDIRLSDDKLHTLTEFLCDELTEGLTARSALIDDYGLIDLWHAQYGQAPRNRKGPWPGAADLGSYIPTEKVDATRAKMVKVIAKAEPLCIVEGRGATAKNAPVVEEFHEWHQQREEKLFVPLVKWTHQGLVERVGVLETYECIEHEVTVQDRTVLVDVDPTNLDAQGRPAVILNPETKQPVPIRHPETKEYIEAQAQEPSATIRIRSKRFVHRGPRHRIVSGKDFCWLPGHARDEKDVWAWCKRFYRTGAQLEQAVKEGRYDADVVKALGTVSDREQTATEDRQSVTVQTTAHAETSEHELFELQVYYDLEDCGPQWWIITLALKDRKILRIKYDTIGMRRYTLGVFFVNPYAVDGYSLVGDKLYTLTEEHAAQRNMRADRTALANNAPILKVVGTNWAPQRQPWAPRAVISVNSPNDITQAKVQDVPESVVVGERMTLQAAERVSGAADLVSSGVQTQGDTTATEVAAQATYSGTRLEEQVGLGQEAIEHLYELRHRILVRMVEFNGGVEVDEDVVRKLQMQGVELPEGKITADLLRGPWRFKPRGSMESADPNLLQRRFTQRYADLFTLMKAFPLLQQWAMSSPKLAEAALQDYADVHKPRNREAFRFEAPAPAPMPMAGPFGAGPGMPGAGPVAPMLPPGPGPMADAPPQVM